MSQLDKFEALKAMTQEPVKDWNIYYAESMAKAYVKYGKQGPLENNKKLFSICQDTARRWANKQTKEK